MSKQCWNSAGRWPTLAATVESLSPLVARAHIFIVVLLLPTGCGLLSQRHVEISTGDLTRGQQPLRSIDGSRKNNPQELFQQARGLYAEGRLQKAQAALRSARSLDASLSGTLELQARIALDLGDMPVYRDTLIETLEAHPGSAVVQNRIGKRLVENGHWETGTSALNKACELAPRNAEYARGLAAACLGQSDTEAAASVLTQAMRRNPRDVTIAVALARIHESAEDWSEASRYYNVALQANEQNLTFRRLKARCLYRLGDYAAACDLYSSCIESDAGSVALSEYAEYGDACLQSGDIDRAQMVYDRIARYSPVRSREVELLRIVCAIRRKDVVRADSLLRDALLLWPDDTEFVGLAEVIESTAAAPE